MKDVYNTKQRKHNIVFFISKILVLFFCAAPLFQSYTEASFDEILSEFILPVLAIILTIAFIFINRNRKAFGFFAAVEIILFFTVCGLSIIFTGAGESSFKFLFLFLIAFYTIEYGFAVGFAVSSLSVIFVLLTDIILLEDNTNLIASIILCLLFITIGGVFGIFVKTANSNIVSLIDSANIDSLTKVYNHHCFQESIRVKCQESLETGKPLAILMLDIDYFKTYNDIFGHQKGDIVLKQLASLIKDNVRNSDMVFRYGGEEFVIILDNTENDIAIIVGERIRKAVEDYEFEGQELLQNGTLTISIGVSFFNGINDKEEDFIHRADCALYRAKFFRRNRVEQYVSVFNNTAYDNNISHLKSLINVIHLRDNYTYNHVERVVWYCQLYSDYMKFSEEDRTKLIYSAYLHDLGKINIPKRVLISTGKLTESDWNAMRRHPADSAEIIKRIEGLESLAEIVIQHHERYDGKGYPNGIAGNNIHPIARILALADSFDAMTTSRPYRSVKSYDEAFNEIRRCKGTQFDPQIAENFIAAIKSSKE